MQSNYIITKTSRLSSTTYAGKSWDIAGLRDKRRDAYTDKELAEKHAKRLSLVNPVGFRVICVSPNEQNVTN